MTRRPHIAAIFAALAAFAVPAPPASAQHPAAPRPNILVVLTDDVGWGDFACYNPAGKVPTPTFDRLARQGMRFTNAHSPAALCSPTRYSMVTGNYPVRSRLAAGVWTFDTPSALKPGQKTVANLLHDAGYRTAMYGKAGFGGHFATHPEPATDKLAPFQWGFDYSFLIPRGHQATPHAFFENGVSPIGETDPAWDPSKIAERLLDRAEYFLDDHLAKNKTSANPSPFFIHFCTDGAHSPYAPAASVRGTPLKGVTKMTAHTDMVHETDLLTAKLLDMLDRRGLLADTLVIVTSDNGGLPYERSYGHDAVGGLRGAKSFVFEGGHRVPFIAWWGGATANPKIPAGTIRHQVIGAHDVVATALELAGVPKPPDQAIDSVSLAPVLLGLRDDSQPVRTSLLVQSSPGRGPSDDGGFHDASVQMTNKDAAALKRGEDPEGDDNAPKDKKKIKKAKKADEFGGMAFAILEGDWKLVLDSTGKPAALYDLSNDLAEQKNLLKDPSQSARVGALATEFRNVRSSLRSNP